jgi:predicted phage terminase large subunit-like protein
VLGRGAHIWLIDDPFGKMADAQSPVMRESVWRWFNGTVYNRLEPDGAIVIIGHRMHEDDLQGRLEERMRAHDEYADRWHIIELPAIAGEDDQLGRRPGEALWPEHFALANLWRIQSNTLARDWSSLYQQRPTPEEGELFAPDRITIRDHTSDVILWVRGWDFAGSIEGDWTVGVLIGKTKGGTYVVGHVCRFRGRPDVVADRVLEIARSDTKMVRISIPQDPAQAGKFQAEWYIKHLAGFVAQASLESGDKQQRAEPFAVQVNNGHLTMLEGDWNAAYREELRSFPYGKWDDQVDASSRAFMTLTETKRPMKIHPSILAHP